MTPKSANQSSEERANGDLAWPDLARSSILIVDDEPGMRSFLVRALRPRCKVVEAAADTIEAEQHLTERHFDIVIVDNVLPGKSGIAWLEDQRRGGVLADFILITAYADLDSAIGAIRAGAADFLLKPFRTNQLLAAISRCLERGRLRRENAILRHELHGSGAPAALRDRLTGSSRAIQATKDLIAKVAPLPSSVLFTGESGSGKEVAARSLHALSARASHPFIPINCAAVPSELIDVELFGSLKGTFSGANSSRQGLVAYAEGGTLLFDEVADLPLALQGKLLRMLEDRRIRPVGADREIPIDVRFIFSTNKNLVAEVKNGTFRSDLYYRINVLEVSLPRLHDRGADVLELAAGFMRELGLQLGLPAVSDGLRKLGLNRRVKLHPAALLGAVELSPLEVTQLYQTLANNGMHQQLSTLYAVTDANGHPLHLREHQLTRRYNEQEVYLLQYALIQAAKTGTARALSSAFPGEILAGKTGTSSDYRDSWFSGFDQQTLMTVWLGRDDNKAIGLTGASGALNVFSRYFTLQGVNSLLRAMPEQVSLQAFSAKTGYPQPQNCLNVLLLPAISVEMPLPSECTEE